MDAIRLYLWNVALAADCLVNALAGGHHDETVSYRAASAREKGARWGCVLCRVLDRVHRQHCTRSIVARRWHLQRKLSS